MMTSVTLPSNSAPLHGGYSSVSEEPTDSDFEQSRPSKRCLPSSLADSCKKRRKQSTPVRISAADADITTEGKVPVQSNPDPDVLRCVVCRLLCDNSEQLESHVRLEHSVIECKKEIEEPQNSETENAPVELIQRPEMPWMNDLPNKEWLGPGLLPFSANHMFMSLPQFPQPETVPPRQPIRIFNPDAYCELCNKEFCNKYFLKTHKANKHGIYSDPPTSDNMPTSVNVPSYGANIKLPQNQIPIDIKTEPKPLNQFSDLFTNPFTNKLIPKVVKNIPKEDNENNGTSQDTEEQQQQPPLHRVDESSSSSPRMPQEQNIKSEIDQDNLYYTPSSKMSPGQQTRELDLSNRLRRIGVMNPKAFCEICCKEYCNKYFLRTHKMKRHGIYIPDEGKERGDNKLEIFSNMLWPQNTQTSPLNLIMAEQSNSNSQADRKTSSSPADVSCEICEIKFQNASLLQLHNVTQHPKLSQETSNGSEEEKQPDDNNKPNDTISEDLQKLQTMILQLNDLDVNNKANTTCTMCNKEFENRYFLHAHMMTEHGLLLDDMQENEKSLEGGENNINNNSMCDLCGKDFQNVQDMKKHILEFHSTPQPNTTNETKEEFNGFATPEKSNRPQTNPPVPERRASMNMTPTSSYCEICNKELCNKYFMKTHMQRMHGIEIENGAQIGGVICDICNKELCSKYFLRVHKHNTHGIVEYGTSLLQPRKTEESTNHQTPEDNKSTTDLADLSHRYFTHFTEVCTICSRRFRSTKWLKAHLLSDHGQAGVDKWAELEQQLQHSMNQQKPLRTSPQSDSVSPTIKVPNSGQDGQNPVGIQNVLSSIFGDDEANVKTYHCSYCPFTTPILPFLFVHERSHSIQSTETEFKCPVCGQSFHQSELLQHHIFSQHPFLPLPPFFNTNGDGDAKEQAESEDVDDDLKKGKKMVKRKIKEASDGMGQSLRDVAKRSQLPATYALPHLEESSSQTPYIMQPFLLEESNQDRRIVPSLVFLPVLQKQSTPITVTFTLTPA